MSAGREITLFSGYNQRENRTTNYAILLLKMLYEENPNFLDQALSELTAGQTEGRIGVQFVQQQRFNDSVPDAVIIQEPVNLFVETKNHDWFYNRQLESHLAALDKSSAGLKVLIALSRFEHLANDRFEDIQALCVDEFDGRVAFAAVGFQDFLAALRQEALPKRLVDAIGEFEAYLDEQDLLPRWRRRLDVCSCSRSLAEQEIHNTYVCPATGGHYSHRRSRYFGAYDNKKVKYVADIRAVVDVPVHESEAPSLYYSNTTEDEAVLFEEARAKADATRSGRDWPARVFLLGPLYKTNFTKESPGGMMGSKQYFDVGSLGAEGAEELAGKLDGMKWSQL